MPDQFAPDVSAREGGPAPQDAPRELVEIRVHGVSGTPPAAMLDARNVSELAGDSTTGFFAPDPDDSIPSAQPGDRARRLEGYSWRGMTSGSPVQALFVLLAPFALANAAAAMRPPTTDTGRGRHLVALHAAVVRLFALTLTLTLVAATFIAAVDQVAWQCGNDPRCFNAHTPTKFLGWGGLPRSPGHRVAILLAVPVLAIVVLWALARRSWKARAAVLAVVGKRSLAAIAPVDRHTRLDDPDRWDDREPSEFLRHLHVAAAFAIITAMAAIGLAYPARSGGTLAVVGIVALAVLGIIAVTVTVGIGTDLRSRRRAVAVGLLGVSIALFAMLVVVLAGDPSISAPVGVELPAVESVVVWLFASQIVLIAVIGVLGVAPAALNRDRRVALRGSGSALMCGLALVLGAMFSAGAVFRVGDYLGQTTTALADRAARARVALVVPNALTWAARGAVAYAVIVAALVVASSLWLGVRLGVGSTRRLAATFGRGRGHRPAPDPAAQEYATRLRRVARAKMIAGLTDRAPAVVGVLAALAMAVALWMTYLVVEIDLHRSRPSTEVHHRQWIAQHASAYGSWIIAGFAATLVATVLRARSNERLRRQVGILWDLTTFWPRHAQPLGPPCYNDRALPELVFRIGWHVDEGRDVILSTHSQGSVIGATTVLQLRAATRDRVAFLTYGSPLERLYARWFPAYFDRDTFLELGRRLSGRWQNLHRSTDPIGGFVPPGPPTGPVDRLIQPVNVVARGNYVYPEIRAHSDYTAEPEYRDAVAALDRELRA